MNIRPALAASMVMVALVACKTTTIVEPFYRPADLDRLRTYFREAFLTALGGDYRLADQPATDAPLSGSAASPVSSIGIRT